MMRATELAPLMMRGKLKPGERAADALVGNGQDTHLLAELVGPSGRVFGFDVQQAAVMFNRGYLPGADRTILNRAGTTLAGLEQALAHLWSGGLVTPVLYPGHPGGAEETAAVRSYVQGPLVWAVRLLSAGMREPMPHARRRNCWRMSGWVRIDRTL